jgi:hypothetical protein
MAIEQLNGRRTGRPRGSRSPARWRRDLLWAYRNLRSEDAVPPTELAKRLLAMGREHPDRLFNCLVNMEAKTPRQRKRTAQGAPLNGASDKASGLAYTGPPRRVMTASISESHFLKFLRGDSKARVYEFDLPCDAHVVGFQADVSQRDFILVIQSESFPEVSEGQPIPELERRWCG